MKITLQIDTGGNADQDIYKMIKRVAEELYFGERSGEVVLVRDVNGNSVGSSVVVAP